MSGKGDPAQSPINCHFSRTRSARACRTLRAFAANNFRHSCANAELGALDMEDAVGRFSPHAMLLHRDSYQLGKQRLANNANLWVLCCYQGPWTVGATNYGFAIFFEDGASP